MRIDSLLVSLMQWIHKTHSTVVHFFNFAHNGYFLLKVLRKPFFPVLSPLTKVISFSSIDLSKQKLWTGQKLWLSVYRNFFSLSFVCPKAPPINYIIVWRKNAANSNKKVDDRWSVSLPRKIHKKEVFSFTLFYCLMLSKSSAQQEA